MIEKESDHNLIKPSDAVTWVFCVRRKWLDMHQAVDYVVDPFMQLLFDAGLQHEANILQQLQRHHDVHQATSFDHTQALMRQGVSVIYQARLLNREKGLVGFPDFLIRHNSGLYQAADAKLTRNKNKKALQIQLGLYRKLLDNQLSAVVFLGDGGTACYGDEVDTHVNAFIQSMRRLRTQAEQPDVHYSHSRCRICPYFSYCQTQFESSESLSLLYGIHGRTAEHLIEVGIRTISQLATQQAENIPDVPHLNGLQRKRRAIFQAQSIQNDKVFQLHEIVLPEGAWIHFDIEDNPLTPTCGRHVYLWGLFVPPYTASDYDYVWTDSEAMDYQGWLAFLEKMKQYRRQYKTVVLAHYSNHEKTIIRKYAERYNMLDESVVQWLLGLDGEISPLFDMQKTVRDNLILPVQGYGLKDICKHPKLVNFQWEIEASGSQWSVVQFNNFLVADEHDRSRIKSELLAYNRDDVIATRKLELWLRTLSTQSAENSAVSSKHDVHG